MMWAEGFSVGFGCGWFAAVVFGIVAWIHHNNRRSIESKARGEV